ncbi:VOC family protein [Bremerella sp. JC817]|uniref:VOC family protein n=1 Tax=Bremerella sp. JC817 TaxID=3231756 RepID=UPI0034589580
MLPQPMIAVHDVPASSRWYQQLLGCESGHGGDEYEMIVNDRGTLVLQLHRWEAHEHPFMGDPSKKPYGNGALLWFESPAFDEAVARAQQMNAEIVDGPLFNLNAQHREIWVRDPDGYIVVIASPFGEASG